MSVKTPRKGLMQRDIFCCPITSEEDWKLDYLQKFVDWCNYWRSLVSQKDRKGLSHPTFDAVIQTTEGIIHLSKHLLQRGGWDYLLTGALVSDPLERRYVFSISMFLSMKVSILRIAANYYPSSAIFSIICSFYCAL